MKNRLPTEDFLDIQQLVGKYQWLVDEGVGDAWADLYTSDGAFCREGLAPLRGYDALKEVPKFVKATWNGTLRHLSGSMYVERGHNDDEAIARYYNFVTTWTDGIPKFFTFALSELLLVRRDGSWKIKNHNVRELAPPQPTGSDK